MKKVTEVYGTNEFDITHNIESVSYDLNLWKVEARNPWIWRWLDEHIKVYEQLIKDLKSLKSKK